MVKSICRMSDLFTFISLKPERWIASSRCSASVLFFFIVAHTVWKEQYPPRALGWGTSWRAKYLASTRLNVACCHRFCSHNSWDRNVGSLPRQFYTLPVSRWCFLSGHCVMQPYSPQLYCMVPETSLFKSVPPLRYVHDANLTVPV